MKDFPVSQLLSRTLGYLYSVCYVPQAIRTSLEVLMAPEPQGRSTPEARPWTATSFLHLGGTNTGKPTPGFSALSRPAPGVSGPSAPAGPGSPGGFCWMPASTAASPPVRRRTAGRETPTGRHRRKAGPETALRGGCDRRVSNDRRPAAGLCLDPGHSGGDLAPEGPPLRRPGGQGPSPAHHRQLWRQL